MAAEDIVIDLTNYKERRGSRVPQGAYVVVVDDAELTESQAKNQMVNLWFRITGGEFDGQTITDRLVLTDKSMFRVVGFMQAINLPTPRQRIRLNTRQFIGRRLIIEVSDGEPYNGSVRSEVRQYTRVLGVGGEEGKADEFEGLEEFMPAGATDSTSAEVEDVPEPDPEPASVSVTSPQAAENAVSDDGTVDIDSIDL
jgi:hypothetical protein